VSVALRAVLLLLLAHAAAAAQQQAEIHLRRTPCYGACPADVILLRENGAATFIGFRGTVRVGHFEAAMSPAAVRALLQRIDGLGFATLDGTYGQQNIDSPDSIITVLRGSRAKIVVDHGSASPAVQPIEREIINAAERLDWKPVPSGLRVTTRWPNSRPGEPLRPCGIPVAIAGSGSPEQYVITTQESGSFRLPLAPGEYEVTLLHGSRPQRVTVRANAFTSVQLTCGLR
jgi:hypothetical protein